MSPKKEIYELYNLDEDLEEKYNVIDEFPDQAKLLKSKYEDWRNEMATPMGDKKK